MISRKIPKFQVSKKLKSQKKWPKIERIKKNHPTSLKNVPEKSEPTYINTEPLYKKKLKMLMKKHHAFTENILKYPKNKFKKMLDTNYNNIIMGNI